MLLLLQYDGQSAQYEQALDYMNMLFTGVFTVEFVLKLAAFRFKVHHIHYIEIEDSHMSSKLNVSFCSFVMIITV